MPQGSTPRKYPQPYSSRHVIDNTADTNRKDEPAYMRNFSRFVHAIYSRQTPFSIGLLAHIKASFSSRNTRSSSRKSISAKSADERTSSGQTNASTKPRSPQDQAGFRTLGQDAGRSPTPLSTVPSDFEHIYHYSETS